MNPDEQRLCCVTAHLLRGGRGLQRAAGRLVLAQSIVAAGGLAGHGRAACVAAAGALLGLALLIYLVHCVLGLRVNWDARFFADPGLAAGPAGWSGFDAALARLGLKARPAAARTLDQRCAGALRLLKLQGLALAAQGACAVAGVALLAAAAAQPAAGTPGRSPAGTAPGPHGVGTAARC
jgi:hypothetical protein